MKAPAPPAPGTAVNGVIYEIDINEDEIVVLTLNGTVYVLGEDKKWAPVAADYVTIRCIDCPTAELSARYKISVVEAKKQVLEYFLRPSTKVKIKETFVRWQDDNVVHGARLTSMDAAQQLHKTLANLVSELSPYAKIQKKKVLKVKAEVAGSMDFGLDVNGSADEPRKSEMSTDFKNPTSTDLKTPTSNPPPGVNSEPKEGTIQREYSSTSVTSLGSDSGRAVVNLTVTLPSNESTHLKSYPDMPLKQVIERLCALENLEAGTHALQYTDARNDNLVLDGLVSDLKSLNLRLVDRKENRKVVTMSAKNGHSDKVEKASRGKFTSFMSKFGKIEPSQKNSQENIADFGVNGELQNPNVREMIEKFVRDRGGIKYLKMANDSKFSQRYVDDANELAGIIHAKSSSPLPFRAVLEESQRDFKSPPLSERSTSLDDVAMRSHKSDVVDGPATLDRKAKAKRRAPQPPGEASSGKVAEMRPFASAADVSGSTSASKRLAPLAPRTSSTGSAGIQSPSRSSFSDVSSLSSPSSPEHDDQAFRSGKGALRKASDSASKDKPPPFFVPPPPPDEPPPDETFSPVGPLSSSPSHDMMDGPILLSSSSLMPAGGSLLSPPTVTAGTFSVIDERTEPPSVKEPPAAQIGGNLADSHDTEKPEVVSTLDRKSSKPGLVVAKAPPPIAKKPEAAEDKSMSRPRLPSSPKPVILEVTRLVPPGEESTTGIVDKAVPAVDTDKGVTAPLLSANHPQKPPVNVKDKPVVASKEKRPSYSENRRSKSMDVEDNISKTSQNRLSVTLDPRSTSNAVEKHSLGPRASEPVRSSVIPPITDKHGVGDVKEAPSLSATLLPSASIDPLKQMQDILTQLQTLQSQTLNPQQQQMLLQQQLLQQQMMFQLLQQQMWSQQQQQQPVASLPWQQMPLPVLASSVLTVPKPAVNSAPDANPGNFGLVTQQTRTGFGTVIPPTVSTAVDLRSPVASTTQTKTAFSDVSAQNVASILQPLSAPKQPPVVSSVISPDKSLVSTPKFPPQVDSTSLPTLASSNNPSDKVLPDLTSVAKSSSQVDSTLRRSSLGSSAPPAYGGYASLVASTGQPANALPPPDDLGKKPPSGLYALLKARSAGSASILLDSKSPNGQASKSIAGASGKEQTPVSPAEPSSMKPLRNSSDALATPDVSLSTGARKDVMSPSEPLQYSISEAVASAAASNQYEAKASVVSPAEEKYEFIPVASDAKAPSSLQKDNKLPFSESSAWKSENMLPTTIPAEITTNKAKIVSTVEKPALVPEVAKEAGSDIYSKASKEARPGFVDGHEGKERGQGLASARPLSGTFAAETASREPNWSGSAGQTYIDKSVRLSVVAHDSSLPTSKTVETLHSLEKTGVLLPPTVMAEAEMPTSARKDAQFSSNEKTLMKTLGSLQSSSSGIAHEYTSTKPQENSGQAMATSEKPVVTESNSVTRMRKISMPPTGTFASETASREANGSGNAGQTYIDKSVRLSVVAHDPSLPTSKTVETLHSLEKTGVLLLPTVMAEDEMPTLARKDAQFSSNEKTLMNTLGSLQSSSSGSAHEYASSKPQEKGGQAMATSEKPVVTESNSVTRTRKISMPPTVENYAMMKEFETTQTSRLASGDRKPVISAPLLSNVVSPRPAQNAASPAAESDAVSLVKPSRQAVGPATSWSLPLLRATTEVVDGSVKDPMSAKRSIPVVGEPSKVFQVANSPGLKGITPYATDLQDRELLGIDSLSSVPSSNSAAQLLPKVIEIPGDSSADAGLSPRDRLVRDIALHGQPVVAMGLGEPASRDQVLSDNQIAEKALLSTGVKPLNAVSAAVTSRGESSVAAVQSSSSSHPPTVPRNIVPPRGLGASLMSLEASSDSTPARRDSVPGREVTKTTKLGGLSFGYARDAKSLYDSLLEDATMKTNATVVSPRASSAPAHVEQESVIKPSEFYRAPSLSGRTFRKQDPVSVEPNAVMKTVAEVSSSTPSLPITASPPASEAILPVANVKFRRSNESSGSRPASIMRNSRDDLEEMMKNAPVFSRPIFGPKP